MAVSYIKNELRRFAEGTTFHGLGNAANSKRNVCLRLVWVLAFLLMFGVYVYLLSQTLMAYYGHQVVTTVEYLSVDAMDFPSVTICNSNIAKSSAVAQSERARFLFKSPDEKDGGGANVDVANDGNIGDGENIDGPIDDRNDEPSFHISGVEMISISQMVAHQPKDMYLECAFDGKHQTPCNVSQEVSWSLTLDGFCHTFNSYDIINTYGSKVTIRSGEIFGLYLLINIEEYEYFTPLSNTTGIQVQIHDPNELANIRENGFVATPGTETFVVMKKTVLNRLPEPYAKPPNLCEDTLSSGYENPLKYFPNYSLSACRRECRIDHELSLCNCSAHIYGGKSVPLCSYKDFKGCSETAAEIFNADPSIAKACDCKPTCEETIYDFTVSSSAMPNRLAKERMATAINVPQINSSNIDENILTLKIFFGDMHYTLIQQQSQYTATSLFGELGGNLGLCLGASVLTIAELLQLLGALCGGVFTFSSQKAKRIDVQENKENGQPIKSDPRI